MISYSKVFDVAPIKRLRKNLISRFFFNDKFNQIKVLKKLYVKIKVNLCK